MVPRILFCCVAVVGVLSVIAMFSIARRSLVQWCRLRARIRAQAARVAETARLKVEHAAVLAKLQQSTVSVARGELTVIIEKLEKSARFALPPGPAIAAPPRARMPKGSSPPPIPKRALASRPPPIPLRPPWPPPRR